MTTENENDLSLVSDAPLSLAALRQSSIQVAPESASDEDFKQLAVTRNFLPRINLFQAMSKEVSKRKITAGEFGVTVGKDDLTKLGEKFSGYPLAFRFKAVDMRNKEKILNYFDQRTEEFKAIKEVSKTSMSGCLCGLEFLFFLPEQDVFATYYLSSVSSLSEAQNIRNMIFKPATIKSKLVETEKYSWFVPVCIGCSDPMKEPDIQLAQETIKTFTNPKSSEVEVVTPEEGSTEERAR